jgi:NitT/TauT family transport system permease protein
LASPSVETGPLVEASRGPQLTPGAEVRPAGRGVVPVLAPVVAALAALLVHWLLPDEQSDLLNPDTWLYRLLLQALLGVTVALAVAQWAWRPLRPGVRYYGPLLAGVAVWLGLWDLLTLKLDLLPLPYYPGPGRVLDAVWEDRAILLESTVDSLRRLAAGYGLGVTLGAIAGVLMGWFRDVRYWGVPVMKFVGPIPATVLIPTAMILFSGPFLPGVALIAFAVWFPVTMLTMSGIMNVPTSYFDVARTLGAGRGYLIFRVAIPAALPNIFLGLFVGLLASFLILAVAEGVGVRKGLGYYITLHQSAAGYDKAFGALFIMALFYSGTLTLLFKVRDRVLGWQKGVIRW